MEEIGSEEPVSSMTVKSAILYLRRIRDLADEKWVKGDDEPVFILRGQDVLAPAAVFDWAHRAELHGVGLKKIAGAWKAAEKMLSWPIRKMPD